MKWLKRFWWLVCYSFKRPENEGLKGELKRHAAFLAVAMIILLTDLVLCFSILLVKVLVQTLARL